MNLNQLLRYDLSLLICLHVLLEECNVTRAAQRLHLSQSAVSKSLGKLREQFDDPLFNRTSRGLHPTPKALSLKAGLKNLLQHVEGLTISDEFDPATSDRRFHLSLVESSYPLLMPRFLGEILDAAPSITLYTEAWGRHTFDSMARGEVDFGITGKDLNPADAMLTLMPPKGIIYEELYQDHQRVIVRKGHPVLDKQWNLDAYLKQRHVQVRCDGSDRWLLDYKLAELGLDRDIAMYVPDFNSAASLCTHTDLVFTSPSHFANAVAKQLNLQVLPLPTPLPPMAYTLFWHQSQQNDPGHQWLRQLIISRCRQMTEIAAAEENR
ncbi:LysR substrate-binding domain-containing protein [Enterovibrio sp. ZSDZ35]|uniref:LysR substrate-binding domain-containing protein n=1 Tax=Enterovibrio qingdaonensis TaxID=2899818 RepID=A0ABT5QRB1_9GAMM|nr:LysR substrate-binding domain-containing protein [Enterovibrio sp. ZSDZ35]MDD1783515.1 LysR substrate-binding domain-containing protein [Enterovibrio sp. ZSDZ35]